ncbi:putative metal-dependent hydrolase [Paenibacillus sp. GSMTC-2017]|uniref:YfiT family bacillithiol transferase n=1 Tax=Paenibacillus sp. GSMTC-2017 TaxID=2794350 RepID=UPI0018D8EF40|nr:putative metal-dependent hydrolase [Paenibacillus sp. GSMTC-2017]MBH5317647.1 putative metal-dependent hydrolase [Paenibacillus sp. GSMTC-2017]
MVQQIDHLRFPIGYFEPSHIITNEDRINLINGINEITETLRNLTGNLTVEQLNTPYRLDGWTIQQIIHHLADNDMNAYLRFKRALTEDEPMASSYHEELWAELHDYRDVPIETSLLLLESLHTRFTILLAGLDPENFKRNFNTQVLGKISLDIALQRFIWHNNHHISQIRSLIERMGWKIDAT